MQRRISIDKSREQEGILDFSSLLEAPAGRHGFVKVRDGHFYFEDGTQARFFGFNFPARANMPDHETAEKIAHKLATMGANIARIHASDTNTGPIGWSSNPDSPLLDYPHTSRQFHPEGLDRFDYWIYQLKKNGIYLHIDLLVGRTFLEADGLDYPGKLRMTKSSSHFNERLIKLQKEFASMYLTHVNPYTGLALIDDPAVMAIQICNEDSVFFDVKESRNDSVIPYKKELQQRFNHFLLSKYHTRQYLQEAWTWNGQCALSEDEDPAKGTVKCIDIGDYYQPDNEPTGCWIAKEGPARYADFVEFGTMINRKYYGEMLDYIRGLGAKVPVSTSCLLTGAADIFSHADGDFMENNTYFNHPAKFGSDHDHLYIPNLREYVSVNPLNDTHPGFEPRSNMTSQAVPAGIKGKPFVLSEWNEYGGYPFHSTAFMMNTAYACLQDWDGLILYCYHTCDNCSDQDGETIKDIMDAYNDPSLILQFGTLATVFLKHLVSSARKRIEVVYTKNDLLTQPFHHRMPYTCLPFVTGVRSVFLQHGDICQSNADAVVSAGFVSSGNYENVSHAIVYAHSPYRDVFRRNREGDRHFQSYHAENDKEIVKGIFLNEKYLICNDITAFTNEGDYTTFARAVDQALKEWDIIRTEYGLGDNGELVSDTGEIKFTPKQMFFSVQNKQFAYFSGKPLDQIILGPLKLHCDNQRITAALLPMDNQNLQNASRFLLTLIGASGMDATRYSKVNDSFTRIEMLGKLYIDTFEGSVSIMDGRPFSLQALSTYGEPMKSCIHSKDGKILLDGDTASGNFEVRLL
ncbi:hypothetical protein [Eisenbergiella tayi]|uniref:hypothetical protein n=1 Tax=Eisenbergiella tayi TaxID=1432052 RepID=UPI0008492E1B|nr:hypothetical protein [Eisenbergiella tayi]ODR28288.1 hypothetical protein BEI60_31140 [Eisenbergiella tayi]